jgi:hypothetical protein
MEALFMVGSFLLIMLQNCTRNVMPSKDTPTRQRAGINGLPETLGYNLRSRRDNCF